MNKKQYELEELEGQEREAYGEWKSLKELLDSMPYSTHEEMLAAAELSEKVSKKGKAHSELVEKVRLLKIELHPENYYIDDEM